MEETLLALLTAHFLGDFPFQNKWMVENKNQLHVLLSHVGIITVASFVLLGNFQIPLLLGVFASHLIIDWIKVSLNKDNWLYFVADQAAHVIALVALSYFCHDVASAGWWPKFFDAIHLRWFYAAQCLTAGFVVVVLAGGILIGKLTAPLSYEITESTIIKKPSDGDPSPAGDYLTEGLENGGMYIGWLERFLTLLLILIGHPTGIGFLIAAKSILRFGEIKESRHRKLAEYIIIGTFLSFGWALSMSVVTQKSIDHWLPSISTRPEPITVIIEHQPTVNAAPTLTQTPPAGAAITTSGDTTDGVEAKVIDDGAAKDASDEPSKESDEQNAKI